MGDPRVHFALNCMSVSCPRLPRAGLTGNGLDQELDAAAREFVGEDRNVHVDRAARTVTLSGIFDFYTSDFLAKAPSLIAYVNRYRTDPVPTGYRVVFADYDWAINSQGGTRDLNSNSQKMNKSSPGRSGMLRPFDRGPLLGLISDWQRQEPVKHTASLFIGDAIDLRWPEMPLECGQGLFGELVARALG
jgi:hypothetical protein